MAQFTQRRRFTTSVFVAPLRDVFSLAKSVGTAAGFCRGRLSCGFGAGWLRAEFDIVGQDFAGRGPRMDEMLDVLRLLWSGEVVEYHGAHIDFGPLRMCPAAGRRRAHCRCGLVVEIYALR
jgi:alkanesulfonate monooxygenase SsuD/methylene tetrahydromethanopterin reductase-like flavin-dependent oxidoreductase (luciferase family)